MGTSQSGHQTDQNETLVGFSIAIVMQHPLRTLTVISLFFTLVVLAIRAYGSVEQSALMATVGIAVVVLTNVYYYFALRRL